MAEESIDSHLTSQKTGPEDGGEKANPNGSMGIKKSRNRTPSRYLSGPVGSCHDLCKYGIKHAAEPKSWSPTLRRIATKGRKTKVPEESVVYLAEKKKQTNSPKPSQTSKFWKPKSSVVIKEVAPSLLNEETVSSEKNLYPSEETDIPLENINSEPEQAQSVQSSLPVHSEKKLCPFQEIDVDKEHASSNQRQAQPEQSFLPFHSEKNLPPFEEIDVPMEHSGSSIKLAQSEESSLPVWEPSNNTERETVKSKSPSGSSCRKKSESRDQQMRISSIGSKKMSVPPSNSLSSKHYVNKLSTVSAKTSKNLKEVSHLKNQKNVKEVKPEPASNDILLGKNFHFSETSPENESVGATLACDDTDLSSARASLSADKSLKKIAKQIGKLGSPASSTKSIKPARNGIHQAMPVVSFPVHFGRKGKRDVQRKTHSSSSSSPSSISPSSPSHGRQNGGISKYAKTRHGYQGETAKVANKPVPKRSTIFGSGNKLVPTRKLSFRRGKVIELQAQSNHIPRRLKFRPVCHLRDAKDRRDPDVTWDRIIWREKVYDGESNDAKLKSEKVLARSQFRSVCHLSDIQRDGKDMQDTDVTLDRIIWREKVDDSESNDAKLKSEKVLARSQLVEGSKRRSFRKKTVDGSKLNGSKSGSEQVVLRHQNMEWKKVSRRLYNNVIEETASKLAEQRKSKVKALVGAFETVISLDSHQESPVAINTS